MTAIISHQAKDEASETEIVRIGAKHGWRHDHPAVQSLIRRYPALTTHEVDERLNPNSLTNVRWKNGVLHVFTPFDNLAFGGPSPVSISDFHLPPDWGSSWRGIVIESSTLIFIGEDGSEIIRFDGAGCGNRVLATNAELPLRYYTSMFTPGVNVCGILIALADVPDTPRLNRRGLSYGTVRFRREAEEWVHDFQ